MAEEWSTHPWEIRCLKQHWFSRLPVVLVVCGGTRSVARELGGLGSTSDWASVCYCDFEFPVLLFPHSGHPLICFWSPWILLTVDISYTESNIMRPSVLSSFA